MKDKKKQASSKAITGIAVVAALSVICGIACFLIPPEEKTISGQVEVLQYCVQTQQKGKVVEIRVKEGDYVEVGDTLALFKTDDTPMPEDETLEVLASTLHPYRTGNKEVDRAYGHWQQAKAAEEQAQKFYRNAQQKYLRGKIPAQLRDNIFIEYKALQAQTIAAKMVYEEALHNYRPEKYSSKGPQIIAIVTKVEGEVGEIDVKDGEQLNANTTLMNIALPENLWGTFILGKTQRELFKEGDTLLVFCKAFNLNIPMRVSGIKTNRDANEKEENNINKKRERETWEMQLRPVYKVDGLRAGMQLEIKRRIDGAISK